MNIIEEIREYIAFADHLLVQGLRDGSMSIPDAKREAEEIDKWRDKLSLLECVGCRGASA